MVGIDAVWQTILKPAFDAVMTGVDMVGKAFDTAVAAIGVAWGKIQGIVRPPVEFVVNAVYNNGIRPAWNFIAGLFDLGLLPEFHFAKGGVLPGYAPGKDTIPAMLSPGEGILVPEAVRMLGPETVLAINKVARGGRARRNGQPVGGDIGYLGDYRQHFADGGIAGWLWDKVGQIGSFAGGIVDFLTDPTAAVRAAFSGIGLGGLDGAGQFSEALRRIPEKTIEGAIEKIKSLTEGIGGMGAAGAGAALAWAYSQAGKPYQWGGGGNPSWDCSGFMAGITRVIRGQMPGRIGTTQTMPWPGFVSGIPSYFMIGNTRNAGGGIGHMAGTLLGVSVESAGGAGVRVGNGRGAFSSLFNEHYGMVFDSGGWLPPGLNLTYNGTGKPEPIFTNDQWRSMRDGVGSGTTVNLNAREPMTLSEIQRLAREMDRLTEWKKRRGVG